MYITIAYVFRRLEMELYETGMDDVTLVRDAFVGHPKKESNGVRVKVLKKWDRT